MADRKDLDSKLEVHQATHEDYMSVLALNDNVYDGLDYIPTSFHDFVRRREVINFIGKLDGKVVAYKAFYMDGDKEAVSIGARIQSNFKGSSVWGIFSEKTNEMLRKIKPDLEKVTWSAMDSEFYYNEERMKDQGIFMIDRECAMHWRGNMQTVAEFCRTYGDRKPTSPTIIPSQEQAIKLILDPRNHKNLFPSGYIPCYYNWLLQRITPENVKAFVQSHYIVLTMKSDSLISAISHSSPNKVSLGTKCGVFYKGVNDRTILLGHFIHHLSHGVQTTQQDQIIGTHIRCPLDVDASDIQAKMKPFFGDPKADFGHNMRRGIAAGQYVKSVSKI